MTEQGSRPIVTIGISTFNRAAGTLPEALESALAQTYEPIEIVVCDNASTDGTEQLVGAIQDPRLHYHRHPENIGANANFNACLTLARGDYFILLHDDDLLEPGFVERAMTVVNGVKEPGLLLSGVRLIDAEGEPHGTRPPPPADLTGAELFQHWFKRDFSFYLVSTIFHTQRLRNAGGFQSPENLFQDVVAIARLAARHGYVSVPGCGGAFRRHDESRTTASHAMRWARDAAYLLDVLCEEFPDAAASLRSVGAPYLTNTSYRRADAEASWLRRHKLYREIYALFGRSLHPWRYLWRLRTRKAQRRAKRLISGNAQTNRRSDR